MKPFVCVPLALTLIALTCPGTRAADTPSLTLPDVLSRHLQAVGGRDALAALKTLRYLKVTELGERKQTDVVVLKYPDKVYTVSVVGILQTTAGYDGRVGWRKDTNGSVRLFTEEELKDVRRSLELDPHAEAETHDKITLRPRTERGSGDFVLDVVDQDGDASARFLDPKTFLLVKEERRLGGETVTTTFSDFRTFGGVALPQTVRWRFKKAEAVATLRDVQTNMDVPDSQFAMPPAVKNYQWARPGATSATVPFDYSDHTVRLSVSLNGEPARINLDSGSSSLVLDRPAADILELKPEAALVGLGYGGSFEDAPVKLDRFGIDGAVSFQNLTASVVPLPDAFSIVPTVSTVGFVGYDLLSRFVVRVDYARGQVTLCDPESWSPAPEDGSPLALALDQNVPSVVAQFDGLPPARFMIDTGDSVSAVMLYGPYVKANKVDEKYPRGTTVEGTGAGGEVSTRRVRARSFGLSGVTFTDVPTDLLPARGASKAVAGALGNDLLSRFVVTFDYPHRRVFFAPTSAISRPFITQTFGVFVVELPDAKDRRRSHFLVWATAKSPAARQLGPVQELLGVDGRPVADLGLAETRRLLSAEGFASHRNLLVRSKDGKRTTVTISLFDPLPPSPEGKP